MTNTSLKKKMPGALSAAAALVMFLLILILPVHPVLAGKNATNYEPRIGPHREETETG